MNPDKLLKLMELYAAELLAYGQKHPQGWLLHPQDTPKDKATRVSCKVLGLLVDGHMEMAPWDGVLLTRTCKKLNIQPTLEGVTTWLTN